MTVRITVTVSEAYADRTGEVAEHLRAAGMSIDRVLEALSMVTGTVDESRRPGLDAVGGVASIDVQQAYQLPDPGSDVQ